MSAGFRSLFPWLRRWGGKSAAGGAYSWRVRATDEHGLQSDWSAADAFAITQVGAVPICSLIGPSRTDDTTPRTHWTYHDADGDLQTDYRVQLASDSGFATIVQDSGAVASTDQYHDHTTLAAGTYYRRAMVRTGGTDWSAWSAADTLTIFTPTAQTNEVEVFVDGAPLAAPFDKLTVSCRLDAPTEIRFTVDNFAMDGRGLTGKEEIIVRLKTTAGNRLEFRGTAEDVRGGRLLEVTAKDISRMFERWKVTRYLQAATMGEVIAAMVSSPNATTDTGIVCHCEECPDPIRPGDVVRFASWSSEGKTIAAWLSEFQRLTDFRWFVRYEADAWHFYWLNPATAPVWEYTIVDSGDAPGSGMNLRTIVDPEIVIDGKRYNRVLYHGYYHELVLPPGKASWDEVFSESTDGWIAYPNTVISAPTNPGHKTANAGSNMIRFVYTKTATSDTYVPQYMDLGCFALPEALRDLRGGWTAELHASIRTTIAIDGARVRPSMYPGAVYGVPVLLLYLPQGSQVGPRQGARQTAVVFDVTTDPAPWASGRWLLWGDDPYNPYHQRLEDEDKADCSALSLTFGYPFGKRYSQPLLTGQTLVVTVDVDNLFFSYRKGMVAVHDDGLTIAGLLEGDSYVETAAVTAGTEVAIETEFPFRSLPMSAVRPLAKHYLDTVTSVARKSVSNLELSGIREVPMHRLIPLSLAQVNVTGNYPPVEITYKPLDSGNVTSLVVGDLLYDWVRQLERVAYSLDALRAGPATDR